MSKRLLHKSRICRQSGEALWVQYGKTFKSQTTPGEHGKTHRKTKDSRYEPRYSTQLREKQKFKKFYGEISETQFSNLFQKGMGMKGNVMTNLFSLFERRLHAVVYRLGFASSLFEARQLINHGHILVNGKITQSPYSQVENFNVISLHSKKHDAVLEKWKQSPVQVPSYLDLDLATFRGVFLRQPELYEIPYGSSMNLRSVIEFYSSK
uniref:Ribosomal protein S4 n=1 Tax=Andalucia godoyi TaxID=505711 RepID=M4Q997_ANDGO|nr:ribosomal protein S4 [Andalucia godoyi]AGH23992.1 ribosomal protein S4 [Andalucia godoyi]